MSQQKHLTDTKVSDSVVHITKGATMPKETQPTRLHCAECGIGYPMWVMNETPCEGGEECHDWEDSMNDDEELPQGENVIIGGQSAYKVGGFITWD